MHAHAVFMLKTHYKLTANVTVRDKDHICMLCTWCTYVQVQGMSFLAAVLLLNMDGPDAFICLANLLNRSCYNVFFRVDYQLVSYFNLYFR